MTLDQVKAAKPTLDYDGIYGADTGPWTTNMFIETIYRELSKGNNAQAPKTVEGRPMMTRARKLFARSAWRGARRNRAVSLAVAASAK